MKGLVSLTDRSWFDHLSSLARASDGQLDEVNFWRPKSQNSIHVIQPGAPFFLRLKAPVHAIAGFGFYAHWHLVPFLEAWTLFGEKNGAPSFLAFQEQITSLRGADPMAAGQRPLGCVILRDVVFLEEDQWLPWGAAEGWSRSIVNDRSYDLLAPPGDQLLRMIRARYTTPPDLGPSFALVNCDERAWRDQVVPVREGQGTFRLRMLEAYGSKCAITGERVVPVLEAAHIQAYLGPASNHVQNGLLLRSDLHKLYDEGLVTVTPDLTLRVSERIHDEWKNGHEYYAMAGKRIADPRAEPFKPSRDALEWHGNHVFR